MNKQAQQLLKEGLSELTKSANTSDIMSVLTHPVVLGALAGGGAGTGLGYLVDDPANYGAAGVLGGSAIGLMSDPESKAKVKEYLDKALSDLEEAAKKSKRRRGSRRIKVETPIGEVEGEITQ